MQNSLWQQCLRKLETELSPQQYNTWIRPLQAVESGSGLELLAPNRFVLDWIRDKYSSRIKTILEDLSPAAIRLSLGVGSLNGNEAVVEPRATGKPRKHAPPSRMRGAATGSSRTSPSTLSWRASRTNWRELHLCKYLKNPGKSIQSFVSFAGGVGLGKTHLMHAVGNLILADRPALPRPYICIRSAFVADMVKALQHNAINDFQNASIARSTHCSSTTFSSLPAKNAPRKSFFPYIQCVY